MAPGTSLREQLEAKLEANLDTQRTLRFQEVELRKQLVAAEAAEYEKGLFSVSASVIRSPSSGVRRRRMVFRFRNFTDRHFPPSARSMGAWQGKTVKQLGAEIVWERASDHYARQLSSTGLTVGTRIDLFQDEGAAFEPRDIAQGFAGNCWLIAAFICVAEREPEAVRNAFVTKFSSHGKWRVRIFDRIANTWQALSIDDHIPLLRATREPVFAKSRVQDLWVVLLEKAFAKYCGGYDKLDGGTMSWALNALTGDPVFRLKRYEFAGGAWRRLDATAGSDERRSCMGFRTTDEAFDSDDTFNVLRGYCLRGALIGASFGSSATHVAGSHSYGPLGLPTIYGLLGGHAYCVLDVKLLKFFDGTPLRLLRLLHPWGQPEWEGAWANGANEWSEHDWVRQVCKPAGQENDGSFWMTWEDFAVIFDKLDVCSSIARPNVNV